MNNIDLEPCGRITLQDLVLGNCACLGLLCIGFYSVLNPVVAEDSSSNVFRHSCFKNEALKVVESPKSPKLTDGTFSNDGSIISHAFFDNAICADTMGFRQQLTNQMRELGITVV